MKYISASLALLTGAFVLRSASAEETKPTIGDESTRDAQKATSPSLAILREEYEKSMTAAYASGDAAQQRLGEAYVKKLRSLEKTSEQRGDLEYVLLIRRERERFVEEKNVDPNALATLPLDLVKAQRAYVGARERIESARHEKALAAGTAHLARLKAAQAKLTKDRKFGEAVRVREAIRNVTDTMRATEAQRQAMAPEQTPPVPSAPSRRSLTLVAIEDAMVRYGTATRMRNYGSERELAVKGALDWGGKRRAFLKFDLTGVSFAVTEARLRLTCIENDRRKGDGDGHELHTLSSEDWEEMTIVAREKPGRSALIATWNAPSRGKSIEIDITEAVKEAIARKRKTLSFCIYPGEQQTRYIVYASREDRSPKKRPALLIKGET